LFFRQSFLRRKAFANFSPALERSDYAGDMGLANPSTPKVLANAFGVMNRDAAAFAGYKPWAALANTFGVIASVHFGGADFGCGSAALCLRFSASS